jgi:AcrR family transcriptional regulator
MVEAGHDRCALMNTGEKMTGGQSEEREKYHHGDLRQALLRAAEEELKEKGVEGFTLRGCARRAGVSHAAPAHHFRDADALLTVLAAAAYTRFHVCLTERREKAGDDAGDQLVALGLGYIGFATGAPALFSLMFSSDRPDFSDPALNEAAAAAYRTLSDAVSAAGGNSDGEAAVFDVAAAWAMVHGISELVNSGRLGMLSTMAPEKREAACSAILARVLPKPHPDRGGPQPPGFHPEQ